MNQFSSRLDRLITLRAREEAERARQLRDALTRAEETERVKQVAEDHLERCHGQAADAATGATFPAGVLRNLRQAIDTAVRIVEEARTSDKSSQEDVDSSREEFGEARQERRVLERLRERAHDSWKEDASRREQIHCDEVARQQWGNREDK